MMTDKQKMLLDLAYLYAKQAVRGVQVRPERALAWIEMYHDEQARGQAEHEELEKWISEQAKN